MVNTALFNGTDKNNHQELWVTDGATPRELTIAGASRFGLTPTDITSFMGGALFNGYGADGDDLWVTNGTSGGTKELKISGADPSGLNPSDLTVVGNRAFFLGVDHESHTSLWVTDGTVAGTQELSSVMNVIPEPPGPKHIVQIASLGTEVLLTDYGQDGFQELWVTDGTVVGTKELMQASNTFGVINITMAQIGSEIVFSWPNTNNVGLWATDGTVRGTHSLPAASTDLSPASLTVFDGKAFFNGVYSGGRELWVTDGTTAGAQVLNGIMDESSFGLNPTDIVVFGTNLLFAGFDNQFHREMWISDGTVSGTKELNGIEGEYSGGISPSSIVAFGNKALFVGRDAQGQNQMWVTNGTAANTQQLTTFGIPEAFGDYSVGDITVVGTYALFEANDSDGNSQLWITDGTVAGTRELNVKNSVTGGLQPFEITAISNPSLAELINEAEGEITAQENTQGFLNPSHLTNNASLVDQIANAIAARFSTPQSYYTIGTTPGDVTDGFVNLTSELFIKKEYPYLDQCVALVRALDKNVESSSLWKPGTAIDIKGSSVANLPVGTPIATFVKGKYSGEHAAVFLGAGVENGAAGFFVLDQYNLPPASSDVVLFPSGTPLDVNGYEPAEVRFIAIQGGAADPKAAEYYSISNQPAAAITPFIHAIAAFMPNGAFGFSGLSLGAGANNSSVALASPHQGALLSHA